ncbi:hypothetical protein NDA18_003701 [Ustilago nuda]|nr:hypothetical protein NDA18_003701 [Ustilago nuda]
MALPTSRTTSNVSWDFEATCIEKRTMRKLLIWSRLKLYLKLRCWRPHQGWKHISRLPKMQGYSEGKTSSNTNRNRLLPWRVCLRTESRSSGRRKHWILGRRCSLHSLLLMATLLRTQQQNLKGWE